MQKIGSLAMAASAVAAGMSAMGEMLADSIAPHRRYIPSYRARQSADSRKFHIERAAAKRIRKSQELHRLAALGAIGYSPRQIMRNVMMQNGYSLKEADAAFDQATTQKLTGDELQPVSAARAIAAAELSTMTVAELISYGRSIGAKVTTKMTKPKLIDAIGAVA